MEEQCVHLSTFQDLQDLETHPRPGCGSREGRTVRRNCFERSGSHNHVRVSDPGACGTLNCGAPEGRLDTNGEAPCCNQDERESKHPVFLGPFDV